MDATSVLWQIYLNKSKLCINNRDLEIDPIQYQELHEHLLKFCLRVIKIEYRYMTNASKINFHAELGHIQFYRKKYRKAIKNYVTSLTLGITENTQTLTNMRRRMKKCPQLITLRLSICFSEIEENCLGILVLQLISKTPYKLIFDMLSRITIKDAIDFNKYHKYIYKTPIIEVLACEFNKRKYESAGEELVEFMEKSEIFSTNQRHARKQLKQKRQIELLEGLDMFCQNMDYPY